MHVTQFGNLIAVQNSKRTEITGWKAWVVGAIAPVPVLWIFAAVAFFVIGLSITIGALLLLLIPAIVVVEILVSPLRRHPSPLHPYLGCPSHGQGP